MKRKQFIKYSVLVTGGIFLSPAITHLLNASKLNYSATYTGKVIVVGAGAAGLYAAHLLNEQGVDVTVLEASPVYGGRIRSLKDFSDFPVELGAETMYGKRSLFADLVKSAKVSIVPSNGERYYSLDGFLNIENQLEEDEDFQLALALSETFADYSGSPITVEQFAIQQGLSKRVMHIYNGLIGNRFGASNGKIGMLALGEMERISLPEKDNYFLKDRTILSVFEEKFSAILGKVKINTPIKLIDYSQKEITLTDNSGATYTADKIILTVPITVLKSNDIKFIPELPVTQTDAFSKIGMGAGMKIILKFNKRFWKTDASSIIGFGNVPEFNPSGFGRSNYNNVLSASINGENAEHLSFEGPEALKVVLKELDKIMGSPVSRTLIDSHIMDWTKQPYIRGSYSYPSLGSFGIRSSAALPIDNKLFFAGEAMNTAGNFGTVHGAMETAKLAVNELLKGG